MNSSMNTTFIGKKEASETKVTPKTSEVKNITPATAAVFTHPIYGNVVVHKVLSGLVQVRNILTWKIYAMTVHEFNSFKKGGK